jgi:WD40 repeat protein
VDPDLVRGEAKATEQEPIRREGEAAAGLQGHTTYVWSPAFSPDGAPPAPGSEDNTVRLWDTAPPTVRDWVRREASSSLPSFDCARAQSSSGQATAR